MISLQRTQKIKNTILEEGEPISSIHLPEGIPVYFGV